MSGVGIEIGGLQIVKKKLAQANDQIKQKVSDAIQGAGIDCEADAKQLAPVDTGRLRSSIKYTPQGKYACTVWTNVQYAKYIEMGHRTPSGTHVAAQPFLL